MATVKSEYYRLNGDVWDKYYFKTSADLVAETKDFKVLTEEERAQIKDNLTNFNVANKLLKLDSTGMIPSDRIPGGLEYLPLAGGTLTGHLFMGGNNIYMEGKELLNVSKIQGVDSTNINFNPLKVEVAVGIVDKYIFGQYNLNVVNKRITGLADPTSATDATSKQWVEQLVAQGTHVVGAVRAASTGNVTPLSGTKTIDSVALVAGDRVLLKNQTTAAENGVYIVSENTWTKIANDSDKGSLTFVLEGSTNKGKQFYNKTGTTWEVFFIQDTYYAAVNGGLELDSSGFGFKIADDGIVTKMIKDSQVTTNKLANFSGSESITDWDNMDIAGATFSLKNHINRLYSAIKLVRGTYSFNSKGTWKDQTIAGAYTAVETKNRVAIGTAEPTSKTGYNTGDVYLRELSST